MTWLLHQLPSVGVSLVTLVGFVVLGGKRRIGWLIGIVSEVVWIAWAISIHQYGILVMSFAFIGIYWRNWVRWGRD